MSADDEKNNVSRQFVAASRNQLRVRCERRLEDLNLVVPVDDWIDIGAFAKPGKGRKYGKTLYRDRVHVANNKSTYTFTTAELPNEAGVDTFLLLIDRHPDDNTKKVTLASVSAASTKQVHGQ